MASVKSTLDINVLRKPFHQDQSHYSGLRDDLQLERISPLNEVRSKSY